MKSSLIYYVTKIFLYLFSLLPLSWNHRIGAFIGWLIFLSNGSARRISTINIRTCFPLLSANKQDKLVKNSLIELGKVITELGIIWLWKSERILKKMTVEGDDIVSAAVAKKQGVILITPHLGCWEMSGLYVGKRWNSLTFYQSPKIESLDPIIRNARERSGAKLLKADNRGFITLIKGLRNGQVTGFLPDQTPKDRKNGSFSPFFGRPALTMNMVSSLARKSGASVFMCFVKRLPRGEGYHLQFMDICAGIDSDDNVIATTALNQSVEKLINLAPEQYLWSYKRFKQVPDGLGEIY